MEKNKLFTILGLFIISILAITFIGISFTGHTTINSYEGPTQEDQECMYPCMTNYCPSMDESCTTQYSNICLTQCGVAPQPTDETEEQSCTSECILQGCDQYDFNCQQANLPDCEKSCGLIKEPEPQNEEQACIQECVNSIAPGTICGASAEGETGGEVCQQCAAQCEHLYAGPCLDEEKLEEKKAACQTCEHCYGAPIMGDSGEGWECIVDVECKDATSEFGDEPGIGESITETISNTFDNIIDFFSGIF